MSNIRRVIIVGRTNIGKSTLFNRLSTSVKSLTFEQEGVTRDYIKDIVGWKGEQFELVDSAGLSFKKSNDPIQEKIRLSALELFESSQLIVFVVDGSAGLLQEDLQIAKAIHKSGKPVVLAINKMDRKLAQENIHEFDRLGFKPIIAISAQHGTGVQELLDTVVEKLAEAPEGIVEEKPRFKVVILGKPNVGKSSLMNVLLQEQRSIVSDVPGTTREAIYESIEFNKETLELIDTPGVRRQRGVTEELESLMVKSAFRAVRDADIVLLMVDSSEAKLADQELKLAHYAFEDQLKGLILLLNKHDLMNEQLRKELDFDLERYETFLKKLLIINISAKNTRNVQKILPAVEQVWKAYSQQFSDEEINSLFKQAHIDKPHYSSGNLLRLYKAKQIKTAPITIAIWVNEPTWFGPSQQAFFENVMRDTYELKGVPIQFVVRKAD